MSIPFIKYSKFLLIVSALVTVTAIVFLAMWGLKPGIDFTSGSLLEVSFTNRPENSEVKSVFDGLGIKNAALQKTGDKGLIIRTDFLNEQEHQAVVKEITNKFQNNGNTVLENRFETIGPSISKQLRSKSIWAAILVNLGIIGYVAYAFRKVSRPVASWKYGALAIAALFHDVLLVMGVFAFLGKFYGVEVDTAFVVAILTVLGYSVNDTIVVYDRIRENLLRHSSENFADVVNDGLNQTLMRSINTTFKTMLPLFALFFIGGFSIHYFALALLIGIASGAYSSIFIASPLLVYVYKWQQRKA
ncbi:MAG: protein translocase subunit SecF [Candidatus Magasanikbacteria bacterium]|nr:protein translocase subunit SecF [Candidatus Magasanikbacteria bacterium]